jgi:hypothetical protein
MGLTLYPWDFRGRFPLSKLNIFDFFFLFLKKSQCALPVVLPAYVQSRQTSMRGGTVLQMGKGFHAAQGLQGYDLGDLITQACTKKVRKRKRGFRLSTLLITTGSQCPHGRHRQ